MTAALRSALAGFLALLTAAVLAGCADSGSSSPDGSAPTGNDTTQATSDTASFQQRFTAPIEQAHADSVWQQKEALSAGLAVRFGGRTSLKGRMLMATDMGRVRMELGGDTVAVFDGSTAWVAPDSAALPRARFHLLTWPYFAAAPHKLRDPGTRLEERGEMPVQHAAVADTAMPAARLTFDPGTGDSPDDWYMLYRDPQSGRLAAMGYVVTYGHATAEEATPHAVTYGGYQDVEGVPVPTEWTFYNWSEARGPHGEPIGQVLLQNPRFTTPPDSAFTRPPHAVRSSMPAGT
jgi:hypothetical protein